MADALVVLDVLAVLDASAVLAVLTALTALTVLDALTALVVLVAHLAPDVAAGEVNRLVLFEKVPCIAAGDFQYRIRHNGQIAVHTMIVAVIMNNYAHKG